VPVDFLTPEQRARYGRYGEDPTPEQLARCFHLTNDDRQLIDKGQSDRARLGCAIQLGTVRFLGTFLADQTDVPTVVVDHLAAQLGIADPSALKGYGETAMRFKHAAAIRERIGYSDFNDQPGHWRFIRWLYTRAYVAGATMQGRRQMTVTSLWRIVHAQRSWPSRGAGGHSTHRIGRARWRTTMKQSSGTPTTRRRAASWTSPGLFLHPMQLMTLAGRNNFSYVGRNAMSCIGCMNSLLSASR
jgi:hypothetical protein